MLARKAIDLHTTSGVVRAFAVAAILASSAAAAKAQSQSGECGYDRWPVKTMRDHDASKVSRDTTSTSIRALNGIPIPQIPYPRDRRIAPQELTIYRVSGVVDAIRVEDDRDWHIILRDPAEPALTMIVEIPDPSCVEGSPLASVFKVARDSLRRVPRKGLVEITGVGFFDFIHNQRGMARNGFELHPVLSIRNLKEP